MHHIPPGVDILIDECFATEGEDPEETVSPGVELKQTLVSMVGQGITVAAIVPVSPLHIIVVGYREPGYRDPRNDENPPGRSLGGRLKR